MNLTDFEKVAAFVLLFLGTARMVRLISFDSYPPSAWVRIKWDNLTGDSGWNPLLHCAYCLAPYLLAVNMAWAYFSDFHWSWWAANIWLGGSYLASMTVAYDGDD